MPTYEYKCEEGHVFEVMQSITEDPLESCEICGSPAQRVLYAPAVHFKGSGFYTTDYGKQGSKVASGSGSGDSSSGSSSDSGGSGSKSESSSSSSTDAPSGSDSSPKAAAGKD